MGDDEAVPERFRAIVRDAVELARDGRPEALRSDSRIQFEGDDPLMWLREDEVELVPLPEEAWATSQAGAMEGAPGRWWVVVDLWGPHGRTDHSLEGTVVDGGSEGESGGDGIRLIVEDIRVM